MKENPFHYLNVQNPDIKTALRAHAARIAAGQVGTGQEDWDKLERDLMRRYLLSEYKPVYRYPFFVQINLPDAREMWEEYLKEIGCTPGAAPSDQDRQRFERQVAEMVAGDTKQAGRPG